MVLLSHNMTYYPRNFSCELVVHTPIENAKIMMKIEEFYIPSKTPSCVENYLYVFDSNTAKSKAMPEAGGERGLCGPDYPKQLIFTTKSYICIAFHTSPQRPPVLPGTKPGFRVILTAVQETRTNTCPSDNFYCGLMPRFLASNTMMGLNPLSSDSRLYGSSLSLSQNMRDLDEERSSTNHDKQSMGYCITRKSLCDGIINCEDGKDEDISQCQAIMGMKDSNTILYAGDTNDPNNWLSGFLSLGIPASIAIAVSTIVIFTLGIGGVICCCHRCCRINQGYNNHYSDDRIQRRSGAFLSDAGNSSYNYSRSQHRGIVAVNTGAQLSGNLNLVSHVDSNQQNINREWQQSAHFPPESVAVGENYSQRGYNVPTHYQQAFNHYFTSQHTNNEKEIQSHCILQTP
uniref:CUB domain-containing protein n=1 Tax=Trichobilharzia regenti TaxID=157069 RepID=A0AA85KGB3_TRIRE|nr:unnamed protein product [Trichobilharzia regenti]